MRTPSIFQPTNEQIDALVREYPLATLVSAAPQGLLATPLPLLLDRTAESVTLLGHFARNNPQLEVARAHPDALAIFMGPHGYVSPSWLTDRTQTPTWNFATVHFTVRIELRDRQDEAESAVQLLTQTMESAHSHPWSAAELGKRYDMLIPHLVAFRATVTGVTAKFKLGQNERPDVLREAIQGAADSGQTKLAAMMTIFNAHRL